MEHFGHSRAVWAAVGVFLFVGAVLVAVPFADARGTSSRTGPPANGKNMPGVYTCATLQECNTLLDTTQTPGNVKKVTLTADITGVVGNGIVIKRDGVVFDGGGKKITGTSTGQNGYLGIDARSRKNVIIENVEVVGFDGGITIELSSDSVVRDSKINNNYWIGLMFGVGNNIQILNNDIEFNGYQALTGFSSNNAVIKGNFIFSNNIQNAANYPIDLYSVSNSLITENTFKWNNYGLLVTQGNNNLIYHNNFVGNGIDALEISSSNTWNLPYDTTNPKEGGGNHWTLPSGSCQDLFDGATTPQFAGSPDGICDFGHQNGIFDIYAFQSENGWK